MSSSQKGANSLENSSIDSDYTGEGIL